MTLTKIDRSKPVWEKPVPQLQIFDGDRELIAWNLHGGRTVIGRSDASDLALPGDTVSRTHCVIEARGDDWWVVNKSRLGTLVNGKPVDEHPLDRDTSVVIGQYRLVFGLGWEPHGTMTRIARPADHEELLDFGERSVAWRAELRVVAGPIEGTRQALSRVRTRVGGTGAHVVLSPAMPSDAMTIRVSRGRAMVEPGTVPCFLSGQRVREVTPILDGEVVRLGPHEVVIEASAVADTPSRVDGFGDLVGTAEVMQRVFGMLDRASRHDVCVLLLGETGTGKELAARALHDLGTRQDGPFVAVNCASIPQQLVESELFGHEAGAFTGAAKRQDGAFQRAHRGTLFLDELGEMSPDMQSKLLRALESGEVQRVGGQKPEYPDVRVVAATHQNLVSLAESGRFRKDLLFRLAVLTVTLPPLRAHLDDLPSIAAALLARHHPGARLTPGAASALHDHTWPGNVRELRNVLTRAVVLGGPVVKAEALQFNPWAFEAQKPAEAWGPDAVERERLRDALREAKDNKTEAAKILGIARTSLLYKLRKYGLD